MASARNRGRSVRGLARGNTCAFAGRLGSGDGEQAVVLRWPFRGPFEHVVHWHTEWVSLTARSKRGVNAFTCNERSLIVSVGHAAAPECADGECANVARENVAVPAGASHESSRFRFADAARGDEAAAEASFALVW